MRKLIIQNKKENQKLGIVHINRKEDPRTHHLAKKQHLVDAHLRI
jgi:hypothetical protein